MAITGNTQRPTLSFSYRDSHQSLAEVLTLQHANERSGRLLQPVDDVLAIFETTRPHPLTDIAQEISLLRGEIRDDEARHEEALAQHRKHIRPGHRGRRIVLRDKPADRNARKIVEQRPYRLLHGAACSPNPHCQQCVTHLPHTARITHSPASTICRCIASVLNTKPSASFDVMEDRARIQPDAERT